MAKEEYQDIIDNLVSDWNKERPELDASAMQIVGRILKLGKILERRAGQALKESGIYYTDLDVLATLRRSGQPYELTPKQLMKSVLITSGAMTALLERLTKLELIYRASDPKDGRVKLAGLTQKGKKVIDTAIEIRFQEASKSVGMLTATQQKIFVALLKTMLAEIEDA
ncbi:MarR family winged helix-turn-helix transcriptional regulator [Spongiivirga citrea]|uniref:MarR family transcriptional regulator n=1 Tax=Spongiivirga citrea TaxID=1481457 RepID=A0A6M0CLC2_9FLAO|nr:MarR family transcriptional regulator [Spongiivirga citrea]NER18736.1 MarR family transcriptional regulator [Spongiivirga citrea]